MTLIPQVRVIIVRQDQYSEVAKVLLQKVKKLLGQDTRLVDREAEWVFMLLLFA